MPLTLENGLVRWSLDPDTGRWSFVGLGIDAPRIIDSGLGFEWASADGPHAQPALLHRAGETEPPGPCAVEGSQRLALAGQSGDAALQITIEVEMPVDLPMVLVRLNLHNQGSSDLVLGDLGVLAAGGVKSRRRPAWVGPQSGDRSGIEVTGRGTRLGFFANGWQGWSPSGGLSIHDRQVWTRLGPLAAPMFHNPSTGKPLGRGHFVSDMFGVLIDAEAQTALLAGFLTQTEGFGSLRASLPSPGPGLRMWQSGDGALLRPGKSFRTDWACFAGVSLENDDPLGPYLELAGRLNRARRPQAVPTGWSSWYTLFESIDMASVERNLDWLAEGQNRLPLRVFQVDDGFEADVGQWDDFSPGFPDGVKPVADKAVQAGLVPGLWLAPFIVKPRSRWVRDHPEWVLRSKAGRPVSAGYNWSAFTLGLDPTHPGVQEAVFDLVQRATVEWGFQYLKFDFLYAASLPGVRHDPTTTRAQALRGGLDLLRRAAGENVWLLGCGCPLGTGIGVFDSMRIGPDVAARWTPAYQGIQAYFGREPSLPSARNSLQAVLARSALNRRWWLNDPDCLLARAADTHLTDAEVQSLLTVDALAGGALIDSDDLPALEPERAAWLERLMPPLAERARVHDVLKTGRPYLISMSLSGSLGSWWVVAILNWQAQTQQLACRLKDLGLDPGGAWWGIDFWREALISLGQGVWSFEIPAHGIHLMALRPRHESVPAWVGDTLHISQGKQVSAWEVTEGQVRAVLDAGRRLHGRVWLGLPAQPDTVTVDGEATDFERVAPGVYRLDVQAPSGAELVVRYDG